MPINHQYSEEHQVDLEVHLAVVFSAAINQQEDLKPELQQANQSKLVAQLVVSSEEPQVALVQEVHNKEPNKVVPAVQVAFSEELLVALVLEQALEVLNKELEEAYSEISQHKQEVNQAACSAVKLLNLLNNLQEMPQALYSVELSHNNQLQELELNNHKQELELEASKAHLLEACSEVTPVLRLEALEAKLKVDNPKEDKHKPLQEADCSQVLLNPENKNQQEDYSEARLKVKLKAKLKVSNKQGDRQVLLNPVFLVTHQQAVNQQLVAKDKLLEAEVDSSHREAKPQQDLQLEVLLPVVLQEVPCLEETSQLHPHLQLELVQVLVLVLVEACLQETPEAQVLEPQELPLQLLALVLEEACLPEVQEVLLQEQELLELLPLPPELEQEVCLQEVQSQAMPLLQRSQRILIPH